MSYLTPTLECSQEEEWFSRDEKIVIEIED